MIYAFSRIRVFCDRRSCGAALRVDGRLGPWSRYLVPDSCTRAGTRRDDGFDCAFLGWQRNLAGLRRAEIVRRVFLGLCFDAAGYGSAGYGAVVFTGALWNFILVS